jgi:LSD1 subclass zinc finger protein
MAENQTLKCAGCDADLIVTTGAAEVICKVCGTVQSIEKHGGFSEVVENSPAPHRVVDVFRYLVRHPVEMLVWRWNWKAAVFSGLLRSLIYLFTHLKEGWRAALGAMSVEFFFRLIVSGASGSLVQAFHNAAPVWLATLCVMIMLPAFSHMIEFTLHTLNGDVNKGKAITISIAFSIISAIFNLFAMRRDALLVKDARAQSLGQDLIKLPKIVGEFMFYPLVWLWNRSKKKAAAASDQLPPNPDLANRES